ncbi:LytR C-terminal domain-containing protein [Micropruina sp.]|uniref:LytR C-terminal domain-containing protein n=1 Tax=Micropruina sp. TaxID=2737536 RepID=UPI0039E2FCD6
MRQLIRAFKTPVTLVLLLALVAFGGWWGLKNATAALPARPAEPCVMTDVGGKLTPNQVTVRTLNAGLRGGLAKRVSTNLRSVGFYIVKVNNSDQRMERTVVVGNAKDSPEVRLVAGFFKNAKTEGDGRVDHVVDVLLGDDYQGFLPTAPKYVTVDGPVCLPALPASETTATASPVPTPTTTK